MHKLRLIPTAIAAAALIATACARDNSTPHTPQIEFSTLSASTVYVLEGSAGEMRTDDDVDYRTSASILMPEKLYDLDITLLRDTIMKIAFDTVAPEPFEAMYHFFHEAAAQSGYTPLELPDSVIPDEIDGFTHVDAAVYALTPQRLTYRINNETYLPGAAHGMTNTYFVNYDLNDGQIISLETLFTPDGLRQLPRAIAARAKSLKPQIGPTDIDALPTYGNFFISLDQEIVFVYQPYEAASFAQGIIYIPFYPYQLSDYLSDQGLRFFGLTQ